jgi:hypothetical protein
LRDPLVDIRVPFPASHFGRSFIWLDGSFLAPKSAARTT